MKPFQVALFVSAWIETLIPADGDNIVLVALFVSAWIETLQGSGNSSQYLGRTLRECVD